jgi:CheY-like chemotaxis protein
MAHPILLVCDDVSLVAMVRRLLERDGRESVLATSVDDALIARGHYAPEVVVLDPAVEGRRGRLILEEIAKHPPSERARVILLGEDVDGYPARVVPLPLDGDAFLQLIAEEAAGQGGVIAPTGPDSAQSAPSWWHPVPTPIEEPQAAPPDQRAPPRARRSQATAMVSPEASALPAPASGHMRLEQLAELVLKLCNSRACACLELESPDATRTLWLKDGHLVAAASSLYEESLLGRARADGLLDREQEKELRGLGMVSPSELARAMRARGYLREIELVPLIQRNAEQIALEALSEEECKCRLSSDDLNGRAIAAASATPAVQLLPRALARAMSEESILASFGGLDAVPAPRQQSVTLGNLGLAEPELNLLGAVDGMLTVGELLLGSAMRQEQALKTLRLASILGAIEIRPGTQPSAAHGGDVDIRRLKSKFEEIQEADYFAVLGLPRSAGGEEVRQAFEVLSAEFNPLKFAGHLDPSLQSKAEQIQGLLAEAAQTLEDDRLRAAYAGNLTD